MADAKPMRQFLIYVFVLLIPCFALWQVASIPLAMPAIGLMNLLLSSWFPEAVSGVFVQGGDVLLMTAFGEENGRVVPLGTSEYQLGFKLDTRILSYSFPFYTALHFATQREEYLYSYLWGISALYLLFISGLLALCLKQLMTNLGSHFFSQQAVFVPDINFTGLFYQFSVLIIPTLAPAGLWVWQNRGSPLLQQALGMLDAEKNES